MERTIIERLTHLKDTFDKSQELNRLACDLFNKESDSCGHHDAAADEGELFNTCCTHVNNETSTCCVAGCPLRKETS